MSSSSACHGGGRITRHIKKEAALLPLLLVMAACAKNIVVPYPHPDDSSDTGGVVIQLSESIQHVTVMIDGGLVAERERTARVEIEQVPVGERQIQVIASEMGLARSVNHEQTVTVSANRDATVLIDKPPLSSGVWVYLAAALILPYLVFVGY